MILVFVIVISLLIGLMGAVIMASMKAELAVTGHYRRSQEAFNSTDSSARLATLMGRFILHPKLGNPQDLVSQAGGNSPARPLSMEINHKRFNLESLIEESEPFEFGKRYLESSMIKNSAAEKPHLAFKVGGKVVATASVSLDSSIVPVGYSLSAADRYDPVGGGNVPVDLLLTVTGTAPAGLDPDDVNSPRSVIACITRELM
jgi:hypothetical protein